MDQITSGKNILDRFSLVGKVALVTGAAAGIGRGFAHALADAGANVAVVDFDLDNAEKVAKEIMVRNPNRIAIAIKTDVTQEDQVNEMVATVVKELGDLTIACNNAGKAQWLKSEEMPYEEFQKMLKMNLDSVFLCSRAEARYMFKNNYGKIINTASMSGHIANYPQDQSHYNASKAAVHSLTRSLAVEWASRGIRVNTMSPGYTRTRLTDELLATPLGQEILPKWNERIPLGRIGEVEEQQGGIVFLASEASDYMTGNDLEIDGGYTAW